MKKLDTGELIADEKFIREEKRKDDLINEAMNRFRAKEIYDKIAGLGYGEKDWGLLFYGEAIQEAIDIANKLIGVKIKVVENVRIETQTCTKERPVIGGVCICTERCQSLCATIGWVANKPGSSRGIVTVEHAVYVDDWVANNTCNVNDRIATVETAINNVYVDASYSPLNDGIDGSPSIKNLGSVVAWFGYYSVPVPLDVSFNGYGSGGRVNTEVIYKGAYGGKSQQIVIEPVTEGGDSGAAYANYNSDTGKWVLVGLHRAKALVNGNPLYSIGSAVDNVNSYTSTYPYLD